MYKECASFPACSFLSLCIALVHEVLQKEFQWLLFTTPEGEERLCGMVGRFSLLMQWAALHRVAQPLCVVLPAAARGMDAGHQVNENGL